MRIRFVDTLVPLFVASVCAAGLVLGIMLRHARPIPGAETPTPILLETLMFLMWRLWLFSLAVEIVFVIPLMVAVPALRKPPIWLAMIWGAGVGFAFAFLFSRIAHLIEPGLGPFMAVIGAPAGLAYAVTAQWLYRRPVA